MGQTVFTQTQTCVGACSRWHFKHFTTVTENLLCKHSCLYHSNEKKRECGLGERQRRPVERRKAFLGVVFIVAEAAGVELLTAGRLIQ